WARGPTRALTHFVAFSSDALNGFLLTVLSVVIRMSTATRLRRDARQRITKFEEITPHFIARGRWLDRVRRGAVRFGRNGLERHRLGQPPRVVRARAGRPRRP